MSFLILLLLLGLKCTCLYGFDYYVGAGIGDVTGPAAEVNMMGYANPAQKTHGIHIRLFSRAFVFLDPATQTRFAFVNVDSGMVSQAVKTRVSDILRQATFGLYNERNVILSGTHSHSGPAGFHAYLLFDITSLGFVKQSFDAMVQGIVDSIRMADRNLQPATIFINNGTLKGSNINRSPSAYLLNPKEERDRYDDDTDTEMVALKIVSAGNQTELGMINWFPVHGTSMNNTNKYISGDNKGYAAQLFEKWKNSNIYPGKGAFVAAFAQANEGDVSPNTAGPRCIDTGEVCDILHSTCGGRTQNCIAFGPGKDMFESTRIIGQNQFDKAKELYSNAQKKLSGPVQVIHQFVDMTNQNVTYNNNGSTFRTCKPAMGYSFAAGTTDGPGAFDFTQGTTHDNPLWNLVRDLLSTPSDDQVKCHHPKPILLNTGEMYRPYPWQPSVVETQIARVGQLVIVAVPGEFTTMSGRRIKAGVAEALKRAGQYVEGETTIVVAGLSNTYSDYIVTYEEYQEQRYEGASTIFGPHTLQAFINQFNYLAESLATNKTIPPGQKPQDFLDQVLSFVPGVVYDNPPTGSAFGQQSLKPNSTYKRGDMVNVQFIGAHPRNNMRLGDTFLLVERLNETSNTWQGVYTDADWATKFRWFRSGVLADIMGTSEVEIIWQTQANDQLGKYRIRYFGAAKHVFSGDIKEFVGESSPFQLVA